jgi:lipopolysaccharide transport system ATP-binding protein
MTPAIETEGLGKKYRVGTSGPAAFRYRTLRDALTNSLRAPFRRTPTGRPLEHEDATFWALKDVSFRIDVGEVVGLIGSNGAGKSTLLKLLARITEPTTGWARVHGRVGSLLEVGTGFHAELTGRENIYLNAAILGMKRADVARQFDAIIAFAEVERFVDTPVKHYSSGMYLRLAFAVAAHMEPEILLVDEVLAVGDASFQRKCLGKMGQVSRDGRTVLFVSHNMVAVKSLCQRAIWFSRGEIAFSGAADEVVNRYLRAGGTRPTETSWAIDERPGNDRVRLDSVRVVPSEPENGITVDTPFDIEITYQNLTPNTELNISLSVSNIDEVCVFTAVSPPTVRAGGLVREVCRVPGQLLNDSTYRIRVMLVKDTSTPLLDVPDVVSFDVAEGDRTKYRWYGKWAGVVRPALPWRSELLRPEEHVREP